MFMGGTIYSSKMAWGVCHRDFVAFLAAYDAERYAEQRHNIN